MGRALAAGAIVWLSLVSPAAARPAGGTFTGSDGFLVQIPSGWHFSDPSGTLAWDRRGEFAVQNVPVGCTPSCHIDDGQAKIAFTRSRGTRGLASLKDHLCRQEHETLLDCRIVSFGGRAWAWSLHMGDGVELRRIATEVDDLTYAATAAIGLGEQRMAMREGTKAVMLTIRIQPSTLAATGPGVDSPALALVGIIVLCIGVTLQRAAVTPRGRRRA